MTVALINLLSTFSLADPSVAFHEKPIEINSDSTPQNFSDMLAAILLQIKPELLPQQPPKQIGLLENSAATAALHPTFATRLDRVIDRMRQEFGHNVQVVEGYRSQERQNTLYDQGRTAPGPVVTWTKSSKHTLGLAADVTIDGTYDNTIGYQRLAQIASEEGLRTLGARDPGHIELAASISTQSKLHTGVAPASLRQMPSSRTSDVAEVATVAKVAEVADVAKVVLPVTAALHSAPAHAHPPALPPLAPPSAPSLPANTEAAARAERVIETRDVSATRPMSQITLKIDNENGGTDHVRVNVRGSAVDTTITLEDQRQAERLSQRVGELHTSLERRGLEAEVVRINTTREYDRHTPTHRDPSRQQSDGSRQRPRRDKENTQQ